MKGNLQKAICLVKADSMIPLEMMSSLMKERATEVELCAERGVPYFVAPTIPFQNIESNIRILRLEQVQGFPNPFERPVKTLEGYCIFLRSWIQQTAPALKAIEKLGGQHELTRENITQIYNWPAACAHP